MSKTLITPSQIADAIDLPLDKWPGNCYFVCSQALKAKVFSGRLQYGIYKGLAGRGYKGTIRHGWIVTSDNALVDLTRWVFLCSNPFIYISDYPNKEYDLGASTIRVKQEPPEFVASDKLILITADVMPAVTRLLKSDFVSCSLGQLFWIANLHFEEFGHYVVDVYKWITRNSAIAFIPIDYRLEVESLFCVNFEDFEPKK